MDELTHVLDKKFTVSLLHRVDLKNLAMMVTKIIIFVSLDVVKED